MSEKKSHKNKAEEQDIFDEILQRVTSSITIPILSNKNLSFDVVIKEFANRLLKAKIKPTFDREILKKDYETSVTKSILDAYHSAFLQDLTDRKELIEFLDEIIGYDHTLSEEAIDSIVQKRKLQSHVKRGAELAGQKSKTVNQKRKDRIELIKNLRLTFKALSDEAAIKEINKELLANGYDPIILIKTQEDIKRFEKVLDTNKLHPTKNIVKVPQFPFVYDPTKTKPVITKRRKKTVKKAPVYNDSEDDGEEGIREEDNEEVFNEEEDVGEAAVEEEELDEDGFEQDSEEEEERVYKVPKELRLGQKERDLTFVEKKVTNDGEITFEMVPVIGEEYKITKVLGYRDHDLYIAEMDAEGQTHLIPYNQFKLEKKGKKFAFKKLGLKPVTSIFDHDLYLFRRYSLASKPPPSYNSLIPKPTIPIQKLKIGSSISYLHTLPRRISGVVLSEVKNKVSIVTLMGIVHDLIPLKDLVIEDSLPSNMTIRGNDVIVSSEVRNLTFHMVKPQKRAKDIITEMDWVTGEESSFQSKSHVGKYVSFTLNKPIELRCTVEKFDEDGFEVSVSGGLSKGVFEEPGLLFIEYTNQSLKLVGNQKKKLGNFPEEKEVIIPASTYYDVTPTEEMGADMRLKLENALRGLVKFEENQKFQPSELPDVDWLLLNRGEVSKKEYLTQEVTRILKAKKLAELSKKPLSAFRQGAIQIRENILIDRYVTELIETYGENIFDCTAYNLLEELTNSKAEPSFFVMYLKKELKTLNYDILSLIEGENLAGTISTIIGKFIDKFQSIEALEINLKSRWINKEMADYTPQPTKKDIETLQDQVESYDSFRERYERAQQDRELYEKIKREERKSEDTESPLRNYIFELEQSFATEAQTVALYLTRIFTLLSFLDSHDSIGKYASFFRTRVSEISCKKEKGSVCIRQLNEYTTQTMLPELFQSKMYMANEEKCKAYIASNIRTKVDNYIFKFYGLRNPVKSVGFYNTKDVIQPYIVPVQNTKRVVEDVHSKAYEVKKIGKDRYAYHAKLETIPTEDLIIDYYAKVNQLVAFSLTDILYALKEQDLGKEPVNPVNWKPYNQEFLIRMRERYGDLLETRDLPERKITFEVDEEEHQSIKNIGKLPFKIHTKKRKECKTTSD